MTERAVEAPASEMVRLRAVFRADARGVACVAEARLGFLSAMGAVDCAGELSLTSITWVGVFAACWLKRCPHCECFCHLHVCPALRRTLCRLTALTFAFFTARSSGTLDDARGRREYFCGQKLIGMPKLVSPHRFTLCAIIFPLIQILTYAEAGQDWSYFLSIGRALLTCAGPGDYV